MREKASEEERREGSYSARLAERPLQGGGLDLPFSLFLTSFLHCLVSNLASNYLGMEINPEWYPIIWPKASGFLDKTTLDDVRVLNEGQAHFQKHLSVQSPGMSSFQGSLSGGPGKGGGGGWRWIRTAEREVTVSLLTQAGVKPLGAEFIYI